MLRCGLIEYRNNKNYQYAEKWEEFADGTLQKKVVLDDGYGKRSLKHFGWKLNLASLACSLRCLLECFSFLIKMIFFEIQELNCTQFRHPFRGGLFVNLHKKLS